MFAFLGAQEVIVILAIALLVFGPARLPEIGRQIAMAMREMRKMSNDVQSALNLHEYDSRYSGGSTYDTSDDTDNRGGAARSWSSGEYSEPPVNTRPWSASDESVTDESVADESVADVEEDGVGPIVATVEPPGPPALRQSSETSQA